MKIENGLKPNENVFCMKHARKKPDKHSKKQQKKVFFLG